MQINALMTSSKVKRSQNLAKNKNYYTMGWAVWAKSRRPECRDPRVPGKTLKIAFPLQ